MTSRTPAEINLVEEIARCYTVALPDGCRCPTDVSAGADDVVCDLRQYPHLAHLFLLRYKLTQAYEAIDEEVEGQQGETSKQVLLHEWIDVLGILVTQHLRAMFGSDGGFELCSDWQVIRRKVEVQEIRVLLFRDPD